MRADGVVAGSSDAGCFDSIGWADDFGGLAGVTRCGYSAPRGSADEGDDDVGDVGDVSAAVSYEVREDVVEAGDAARSVTCDVDCFGSGKGDDS